LFLEGVELLNQRRRGAMKSGNLIQKVVLYLTQCNPGKFEGLNVNQIASTLNVSEAHLSRAFKAGMGIGLKKFILIEKLIRARFLLIQNQRLRVKDVAIIFDFCSCDYFIRVFKNHVGVSPGKYREIDNGFFGLKDRRKGPMERRAGLKDRRNRASSNTQFNFGNESKDRRTEPSERRNGVSDRRKAYRKFIKHSYH
jgi:AraC-like DNA-binding protein